MYLNKEEIVIEKQKHRVYLSQDNFEIELPSKLFTNNQLRILKKLGNWLRALEEGQIKPITKGQKYFLQISNVEQLSHIEYKRMYGYKYIWDKYKKYHKDWSELYCIINKANSEEIKILSNILKLKEISKEQIIPELIKNSKNLLEVLNDDPSYSSILEKIKNKLKITENSKSDNDIEKAIAIKVLNDALSKMSIEQKNQFEKEIIKISDKENGYSYKVGTVFSALTAAQVSGFGVYLLATSTLSTLSGIIGISLPFAAYTGLSSAISVIIGPVGWIGAGLFTLWKINDVNFNKIIPSVIYISWLREKYSDENIHNFQ